MVLRGVNCHSPLKHYMMFHGGCHDSGNYGSVFNTTYNINCGGHGGFWGGFGYGLGNMLGGFLGNMFGGGMLGGGMFGMGGMLGGGMFGMGGMNVPWMNFWGGGGTSSVSGSSNCTCGCKDKDKKVEKDTDTPKAECIDPDRGKLADYAEKVGAALNDKDGKLTAPELKKLYDAIKADRAASEKDEHHKDTDLKEYDNLLKSLKDKATAKGWGDIEGADFGKTPIGINQGGAGGDIQGNGKIIDDAEGFSDLPDYDKLTDEEKKAYAAKCKDFASKMDPEDLRQFLNNPKLPSEVRVEIKRSFYKQGFTNATEDDLTADNLKKLIAVIDDSGKVGNFENVKVGGATKFGDNWTIEMIKANGKKREIDYVQVTIEDGEIIFHGKQENQRYVLQKDSENNLHLMQYKYHDGYGTADVSDK